MKVRKNFRLDEEIVMILEKVKKDNNFSSEAEAIRYIIQEHEKNKNLVEDISARLKEDNKKLNERLRWATKTAEENSILLLDAINIILNNGEYVHTGDFQDEPNWLLARSKEKYKKKIAHFKQAKDNRERKNKTEIVTDYTEEDKRYLENKDNSILENIDIDDIEEIEIDEELAF